MLHTTLAVPLAALLLNVSLKSLVIFAVAGLACLLLRRASAAARHALWLLVLGGLLCLPAFCLLLPHWSAPVLPAASHPRVIAVPPPAVAFAPPTAPVVSSPPPIQPILPVSVEKVPTTSEADAPLAPIMAAVPAPQPITTKPTAAAWVCLVWLLGTLLVLGRILLGLAAASRLVRRCRPVTQRALVKDTDTARQLLGLTRPLTVRLGDVAVPMTCGVRRPVVLLPLGAADWPADRLRAVLLHEAAHVKRLDWATLVFAQCVCALYWFHPLVWLAAARLRAEAEGACDDLVLACGVPAPDYAAHLLAIVRGLASRRQAMTGTVAMAHRREVAGRLRTILDGHSPRRGVNQRCLTVAALTAVALLAPLAALRPVASDPSQTEPHAEVPTGILSSDRSWDEAFNTPRLASIMAERSHWETTLPNGVRVRLLSIGAQDTSGNVVSSWTPDGRPQWANRATLPLRPDPGRYLFACGIAVPPALGQYGGSISLAQPGLTSEIAYGFPPLSKLGNYPKGGTQYQYFGYAAQHMAGKIQGAFKVSLAIEPETTLISASPQKGAVRRLATGEVVSLSPAWTHFWRMGYPQRKVNITTIVVNVLARFVPDIIAYNINVVAQDGRQLEIPHGFSSSDPTISKGMARLVFNCRASELPLRQVKKLRFTVRPTYTAMFRNFALQPTVSSNSVSPNPKLVKAAADQVASEANLRQIGLGIEQYIDNHHERYPDAAHWMDEIIPYLVPAQITGEARQQRIAALFHDPAAPAGQTWSYVYNRAFSGLSLAKDDSPALTVTVFESSLGTRNASDGGQSVPRPGWHTGGSDFLFADGHVKWLNLRAFRPLFSPHSAVSDAVPIQGRIYDRLTGKPTASTFVIFSQSPHGTTRGSVWPSSFTNKAGRFQSFVYPGKNYLMVLTSNRFKPFGDIQVDISSGNTHDTMIVAKGGSFRGVIMLPGRVILLKSPLSRNVIKLLLPNAHGQVVAYDGAKSLTTVTTFMPIPHAANGPQHSAHP